MPDSGPFADRLRKGIFRIASHPPEGGDAEAIEPLRRSLERTVARLAAGTDSAPAPFRFQLTGGKPLLFQGKEALPLEPARLVPLLNSIQVELQPGESLDLDGALAAWLIRPDATLTESNLRQADITLRTLKTGRDRDHAAAQAAESIKIRLRSRLTQLVSALQMAQGDTPAPGTLETRPPAVAVMDETPAPAPPPTTVPVSKPVPPPAAPPAPLPQTPAATTDSGPSQELIVKALGKLMMAIEGSGFKAAVIGDLGHRAWGSTLPIRLIEVLVHFEGPQRDTVLSAARGEGLRATPDGEALHLQYTDSKVAGMVPVHLVQAVTAFHKQVLTRAQMVNVLRIGARVATCDDLILLRAGSSEPGHRESVIDLLRAAASRIDAAYLKKEAEAAGVFDKLKSAWQQARQQG